MTNTRKLCELSETSVSCMPQLVFRLKPSSRDTPRRTNISKNLRFPTPCSSPCFAYFPAYTALGNCISLIFHSTWRLLQQNTEAHLFPGRRLGCWILSLCLTQKGLINSNNTVFPGHSVCWISCGCFWDAEVWAIQTKNLHVWTAENAHDCNTH